ncbi:uncharacterized protein LOC122249337 [Penaeus japonicus]|uniref:uncharacterized protein LOC122249337 n=1 Tax=Penaeus japonicus TaxID=27405 RepID=UPI001C70EBDA|nr:uncharacterized protein LOC122249337 [Penaeus japonicus]XP_042866040.1 uncharacterized protein LOC122249337 [Penaeus japonicus]XP_042866041.1 uncharacterized protein LOC122249337 [Penaeus japonicus]
MEHDCGGSSVSPDKTPVDPPEQPPSGERRKSPKRQTEEESPEATGAAPKTRIIINETIDIITVDESYLPHVEIELEGIPVLFVVDTGSNLTSICRKQMTVLGFEESDLKRLGNGELKYLVLNVRINDYEMLNLFIVKEKLNFHHNLLGLDFLEGYCCIIDLDKNRLTFREYKNDAPWDMPKTIANIHGKDIEVEVDTASGGYIDGPLSLAKELDLPLQPVHGKTIVGVDYELPIPYVALDLCLKAFGREVHNAWFVVQPDNVPEGHKDPSLGVFFLYGMRLQFNMDGTFEVTEPTQEEETGDRPGEPRGEGEGDGHAGEKHGSDERPDVTDAEKPQKSEEELTEPRGSNREWATTGGLRGSDGEPVATGEPQRSEGEPVATGEPQGSEGEPVATGEPQGSEGEPVATGEPQGSEGEPVATGEPQGSEGEPVATGEPQGSEGEL